MGIFKRTDAVLGTPTEGLSAPPRPGSPVTERLSDGAALEIQRDILELAVPGKLEIRFQDSAVTPSDSLTPEHPDRYAPSFEVGRGGIGRVYIASDRHLNRSVAVKELLVAGSTGRARQQPDAELRFVREARITGQLEHPNIIPIYELGRRDDGSLYYTMPVIHGQTLASAIFQSSTLEARLGLMQHFRGACQAVAYAHSRGVIHRDLKPDNIMIGQFGETIVLDWGLAKVTDAAALDMPRSPSEERRSMTGRAISLSPPERDLDPTGKPAGPILTQAGAVFGTPAFMSPEQALGYQDDIDERADVWSLGAVLFTLLLGHPPFDGQDAHHIISNVLTASLPDIQKAEPNAPRELIAIAQRALCRELELRYRSAAELLGDVESYLSGAGVKAYQYSIWETILRLIRRNRGAFVVGIGALLSLIAFGVIYQVKLVRARDQAIEAQLAAQENAQSAAANARHAELNLSSLLVEKATTAMRVGDATTAATLAHQALRIQEEPLARGIAVTTANAAAMHLETEVKFGGTCAQVSIDRGGVQLACLESPFVSVWSVGGSKPAWRRKLSTSEIVSVHMHPSGAVLAVLRDGALEWLSAGGNRPLPRVLTNVGAPARVAVSADMKFLAMATTQGRLLILDGNRGTAEQELQSTIEASALEFSADGKALAVGGKLGELELWSLATRSVRRIVPHTGSIVALGFSPDGRFLATGSSDRSAGLWEVKDLGEASRRMLSDAGVSTVAWSNDGRYLAMGSEDKSVRVLDLREPSFVVTLPPAEGPVRGVRFMLEGAQLTSVTERRVRVWSRKVPQLTPRLVERSNILSLRFDRTGEILAGGLRETGICAFDLRQSRCSTRLPVDLSEVRTLSLDPRRRWLLAGGTGGDSTLWDLETKLPLRAFRGHAGGTRGSAFSLDGRYLATVGKNGSLTVFEISSGAVQTTHQLPIGLSSVAWSELQHSFLMGRLDGQLQFVDPVDKRLATPFKAHDDWTLALDVAEDGSRLLSAGADGRVQIWDARSQRRLLTLKPHPGRVFAAAFSPDGRWVASGGEGNVVFLWDAQTGALIASLLDHQGAIRAVRFAPGRPILASASDDGTIRLWDLSGLPPRHVSGKLPSRL